MSVSRDATPDINPLADLMARLRDPECGCPWDIEQNFASIAPYTVEEAYEVADAIERHDLAALKDELGDLLLQVVFHSRMAEELGAFDLGDVITGITSKMTRRHPHVFGDGAAEGGWEAIKAGERDAAGATSALEGVATALPALLRAQKLQKRAARTGFEWPDIEGVKAKIAEEMIELAEAPDPASVEEEAGDLLFAVVNLVRYLGVDAETALRRANVKFERRFRAMEAASGDAFAALDLAAKEALWQAVKATEQ